MSLVMKPNKLYGIFIEHKLHVRGYVGPEADRLSSAADVLRLSNSGYFSRTHVKPYYTFEAADKKRQQFHDRNMKGTFVVRISKHNNYISMGINERRLINKQSRELTIVKFNVNPEKRNHAPYRNSRLRS